METSEKSLSSSFFKVYGAEMDLIYSEVPLEQMTPAKTEEITEKKRERAKYHRIQDAYLFTLDESIRFAEISLNYYIYYRANKQPVPDGSRTKYDSELVSYYAQTYISYVRKVWERLEKFNNSTLKFPAPIADAIVLVRKKKKTLMEKFVKPRDVNTHRGERIHKTDVNDHKQVTMINAIIGNIFAASEDSEHQVEISPKDLETIFAGRNEICDAMEKYYEEIEGRLVKSLNIPDQPPFVEQN